MHTDFVYQPPAGPPAMLHLDADLMVVDKPSGLLSVPGRLPEHHDSALQRLQAEHGPLWVVHRLDMDTSGVLVLARHREAAAALGRCFEQRRAFKLYRAVVWGRPPSGEGRIALPLRLDWPHRPRQLVDGQAGKASVTDYCVLQSFEDRCLLELKPLTGRSHQLRVHLQAVGCPILGDRFYGRADGQARLMLHAQRLRMPHPRTGQDMHWEAPPPF